MFFFGIHQCFVLCGFMSGARYEFKRISDYFLWSFGAVFLFFEKPVVSWILQLFHVKTMKSKVTQARFADFPNPVLQTFSNSVDLSKIWVSF